MNSASEERERDHRERTERMGRPWAATNATRKRLDMVSIVASGYGLSEIPWAHSRRDRKPGIGRGSQSLRTG